MMGGSFQGVDAMRSMAELDLPKPWREGASAAATLLSRDGRLLEDAKPLRALAAVTLAARQSLQRTVDGARGIAKIDAPAPTERGEANVVPAPCGSQGWNEIKGLSRHDVTFGFPFSQSRAFWKLGCSHNVGTTSHARKRPVFLSPGLQSPVSADYEKKRPFGERLPKETTGGQVGRPTNFARVRGRASRRKRPVLASAFVALLCFAYSCASADDFALTHRKEIEEMVNAYVRLVTGEKAFAKKDFYSRKRNDPSFQEHAETYSDCGEFIRLRFYAKFRYIIDNMDTSPLQHPLDGRDNESIFRDPRQIVLEIQEWLPGLRYAKGFHEPIGDFAVEYSRQTALEKRCEGYVNASERR